MTTFTRARTPLVLATLVLVEEVTDGGWGIGGNVVTLAQLQQTPDN